MRECEWCGASVVSRRADARFCSGAHRVAAHRRAKENPLPADMLNKARWIRHSKSKVPLTVNGTTASSTDPTTWTTYTEAVNSTVGVGLGFVLGDGIGGIDLDHCLIDGKPNKVAARFLETVPGHYIEISPSGDGLHVFGTAEASAGSRKTIDGLHIERYSTGRYFTITRNVYQHGNLLPL